MARPRLLSDDEILDATMRVVTREGAFRFTLAQVGEEAGISAPGILKRFGTRRALLLALSARSRREPQDALADAKATRGAILDGLVDGLAGAMAPLGTRGELAKSLEYLSLDIADADFNEQARAFFGAMRAEVHALLERALAQGELRACDTAALARAMEVAFNGSAIAWGVHGEASLQEAMRRDLAAVLAPFRTTRRRGPAAPSPRASRRRGAGRASRGT